MADLTGSILQGRYKIEALIGRGGMAEVYRAYDTRRGYRVAIKVLHEDLAEDRELVRRFKAEAEALSLLNHDNIVRYYSFERDGFMAFIVMDYIEGETLRRHLMASKGSLTLDEALGILKKIGLALQYAHAEGILHRDIKPANVMLASNGQVLLADFGIAKMLDSATMTAIQPGTPPYMAPEQYLGHTITKQTDIYGLGVMAYEMLAGRRPFLGETHGDNMISTREALQEEHLRVSPPPPELFNPQIPEHISSALLKALAKSPEERFASVNHFIAALQPTTGIPEIPNTISLSSEQSGPAQPVSGKSRIKFRERQRSVIAGITIIALLLVVGVVAGIGYPSPFSHTPTSTDSESISLVPTETQIPATSTRPPPTKTPIPTAPTEIPTKTPEPSIGSTKIAPVDQAVMVYVPEGEFLWGSTAQDIDLMMQLCPRCNLKQIDDQSPQRRIYQDAFWIDQTEVTIGQFSRFVRSTGYLTSAETDAGERYVLNTSENAFYRNDAATWLSPSGVKLDLQAAGQYPVAQVSWYDARAYCQWAGRRLPTEAEWEKAASGTIGSIFPWGNSMPEDQSLNYNSNYGRALPVGSFPEGKSFYGALDMSGNVWEWVADYYQSNYYQLAPDKNPSGPSSGEGCIQRGGGWGSMKATELIYVTTKYRRWNYPLISNDTLGFRCASDK